MAQQQYTVALHNVSGFPRDDSINVLYFDNNFPDTVEGNMDDIAAAYQARAGLWNSGYAGLTVKAYDIGGGPPIESKNYTLFPSGGPSPSEVALCLSYSADDNAAGTPRRRGRIYLPVFGGSMRPSAAIIESVLSFGELLAQVGTAGNTTWFMRSVRDSAFRKIESISVDDAWDTQRRRGLRPLTRTRRDVQ